MINSQWSNSMVKEKDHNLIVKLNGQGDILRFKEPPSDHTT